MSDNDKKEWSERWSDELTKNQITILELIWKKPKITRKELPEKLLLIHLLFKKNMGSIKKKGELAVLGVEVDKYYKFKVCSFCLSRPSLVRIPWERRAPALRRLQVSSYPKDPPTKTPGNGELQLFVDYRFRHIRKTHLLQVLTKLILFAFATAYLLIPRALIIPLLIIAILLTYGRTENYPCWTFTS